MTTTRWILGITGGISAYKTPELVRLLKKQGCDVRTVLSKGGEAFVTPLTLQAVSGDVVYSEIMSTDFEAGMGHIELARWAEGIIIAPLSANRLAALALGMADDLLTTLCLATRAPIFVAPAMNTKMWEHPATAQHINTLKARGITILGPAFGEQACGEIGLGRMLAPEEIVAGLFRSTAPSALTGKKVLITAGPTREMIDPVRYLSNRSSGKMGFALAKAAKDLGMEVTLISGPVSLTGPAGIKRIDVVSAKEMSVQVLAEVDKADIFISAAAVADYRPEQIAIQKLKKQQNTLALNLVKNPDILAAVAILPKRPFCVGFAAETHDLIQHAQKKLHDKNIDIIAMNDVSGQESGFDVDINALTVLTTEKTYSINKGSKYQVALSLWQIISECIDAKNKIKDPGSTDRQRNSSAELCD